MSSYRCLITVFYGSGVWGCEHNDIVEKRHLKICRIVLGVTNKTSKCMVYGEFGRTPLQASIDQNVLGEFLG